MNPRRRPNPGKVPGTGTRLLGDGGKSSAGGGHGRWLGSTLHGAGFFFAAGFFQKIRAYLARFDSRPLELIE